MLLSFLLDYLPLVVEGVRHMRKVASEARSFAHLSLLGRVGEEVAWLCKHGSILCLPVFLLLNIVRHVVEVSFDLSLESLGWLEVLIMTCLLVALVLLGT